MTALVFGASGSLGSSTVRILLAKGCEVHAVSRANAPKDLEGVSNLAWERVDTYSNWYPRKRSWDSAYLMQGVFVREALGNTEEATIRSIIDANLTEQIVLTRRLLEVGDPGPSGRRDIVFIGSTSSYAGFAESSVYCASKFALRGLVEALNAEYKERNTRFWLASMGSMDNDMGRAVPGVDPANLLDPGDVAGMILDAVGRDTKSFQPEMIFRRRIP